MIVVRLCMPDRPGMLASVAAAVSAQQADIVTIDVVHRAEGLVVDNLCLEIGPVTTVAALRRALEAVSGVAVEVVRTVDAPPSSVDALELAAALAGGPEAPLAVLVEGLPRALGAEWAMALELADDDDDELRVLHLSARAPAPPVGRVPWLPLQGPRRLAVAPWMPTSWRLRSMVAGGLEVAASPLGDARRAVAVARDNGRFRPAELRQLAILSQLAVRGTPTPVAVPAQAWPHPAPHRGAAG